MSTTTDAADTRVEISQLINERPLSPLQIRVVVLCAIVVLFDGYDFQTMALVVPTLAGEWSLQASSFGLVLSAALIGTGVGSAFLAQLGDRWGRRPTMMLALVLLGASSILTAFSSTLTELVVWRFMTGVGLGTCQPIATALTSDYMPARRRAALVTLMFVNVGLGAFMAGFIAPVLIRHFGWQSVFILGGVVPLLLSVVVLLFMPESPQFLLARRPQDRRIAGLVRSLAPDIDPAKVFIAPRDAAPRASPLTLLASDQRSGTLLLWSILCLNLYVLYFLISWLPTLLIDAGWAADTALRGSVMIQLGGICGGLAIAMLIDRGKTVFGMVTAYIGAAVLLGLFLVVPARAVLWVPMLLLLGAGIAGAQATIYALAAAYYPSTLRATGVGWAAVVGRIGAVLGPLTGAWILKLQLGTAGVLGLLILPTMGCAACALLLPRLVRNR